MDKPKVQFREPKESLRPYTDDNLRHELIREDFPELAKTRVGSAAYMRAQGLRSMTKDESIRFSKFRK